MGDSQKAKGASALQNTLKQHYGQIGNDQGFDAFNNYKTPFGFNEMSDVLNKTFDLNSESINRTADSGINKAQRDTAERLASQGNTGGSVLNTAVNASANPINISRFNTLQDLATSREGRNINLMDRANQNQFQNTSAKLQALLSKYGLLSGNLGQQQGNISNLNDKTFWDDLLSGLNAGANITSAVAGIPGI
jgi:hypothetical protein